MDIIIKGFTSGVTPYGGSCTCDCNCNCNCVANNLGDFIGDDVHCALQHGFSGCSDCNRYTPSR